MIGINENELPGLQDPLAKKEGHQKVELFISCRQLKNLDIMSLSDPQVKIYLIQNNQEQLFGSTEIVRDNLNPNFVKTFVLDYVFEVKQPLKFQVIDVDAHGDFDHIGDVHTSLCEIMGSRNQILISDIVHPEKKKRGKLVLRTEIIDGMQSHVNLEIVGKKLTNNAGFFRKSSPFFQLSRVHEETTNVVVYQSSVILKNLNPVWKPFKISVKTLCNNDEVRPILCSVYHKKTRTNKLMGQCTFSIDDLNQGKREFPLKKQKGGNKTFGTIQFNQFSFSETPSFLEYIRRGIQLNVIAAIDYTSSNGNPKSLASLHAVRPDGKLNDYQNALLGVCDILLCYDYDKKVPMYGFGGKPFGATQVSHCFSLTGNEDDPSASGLDGIMGVYQDSLKNVNLSSPTFFKSILRKGMEIATKAKQEGSNVYTILLILTDGLIHDMQPAIDCLVDCAELPLSVIIVGVGNEDFTMMEKLDADNSEPLCNSKGQPMRRDIVQFVAFNKFKGDKEALAAEVLAEVPRQLIEYMQSQGISPKKPEKIDVNNFMFARGDSGGNSQVFKREQSQVGAQGNAI